MNVIYLFIQEVFFDHDVPCTVSNTKTLRVTNQKMSNESIDGNSHLNNNCPLHESNVRGRKAVFKRHPNKQTRYFKTSEVKYSMCVCVCLYAVLSCSVVSHSLRPFAFQPTRLHCPRDFSGKNTGVGCRFLLQGIFSTQGSKQCLLCLLRCRQILYLLSYPIYYMHVCVCMCVHIDIYLYTHIWN